MASNETSTQNTYLRNCARILPSCVEMYATMACCCCGVIILLLLRTGNDVVDDGSNCCSNSMAVWFVPNCSLVRSTFSNVGGGWCCVVVASVIFFVLSIQQNMQITVFILKR